MDFEAMDLDATHLYFQTRVSQDKPMTVNQSKDPCPFCDRARLRDILLEDGPIILLKNKYPVLADTEPLVLIETDDCSGEFSEYSPEHLLKVMDIAVSQWLMMVKDPRFASVLFLKNHGPLSGGTIRHPHMQIIGLEKIDCCRHIRPSHFQGLRIHSENQVELNLSAHPLVGFYEFNLRTQALESLPTLALLIQKTVHFLLNAFRNKSCNSYNIFFYYIDGAVYCKIIPRYVVTPVFMGYLIPQIPDNLQEILEDFQTRYF
jgi:ATP adenylyltransferase/5',5'''-P-1,P-4-tetraphosphate phosphorylase II